MKLLTMTVAVLMTFAGAACARIAKVAAPVMGLVCPVTGEKIGTADNAFNHEVYHGKTYYFCCPDCKPRFDKNPAKTIANAAHGKYLPM
ncbi:MAG: YHS domain-containing protein [Janthinobacterium lividum]